MKALYWCLKFSNTIKAYHVFYYSACICWNKNVVLKKCVLKVGGIVTVYWCTTDLKQGDWTFQYVFWSVLMCLDRQTHHRNAIMLFYAILKKQITEHFSFTVTVIFLCKPLIDNHLYMILRISGHKKKWNSFCWFASYFLKLPA